MRVADLELDLDVFAGPFDLLLTLILREEIELAEVDLAQIVLSYIEHLELRGELDLEAATEFLVLIAALLELKSRLLLPGEEQEMIELDPGEAAEELLARLLDAHRFRDASGYLQARLGAEQGYRLRSAPPPRSLLRASLQEATKAYDATLLARALGDLLRAPPPLEVRHILAPKVTVAERLAHLRTLLRRGSFSFEDAVARGDRMTIATTLFALLELYRQGEATWSQERPFAAIEVKARDAGTSASTPVEAASA